MMTEQEINDKIDQLVVFWEKDYRKREKSNSVGDALCFAMEELADWFLEKIKSEKISLLTDKEKINEVVNGVISKLDLDKYRVH